MTTIINKMISILCKICPRLYSSTWYDVCELMGQDNPLKVKYYAHAWLSDKGARDGITYMNFINEK